MAFALDDAQARARARKQRGAWYTPPELVAFVLDHALEPALDRAVDVHEVRFVDPACGDGNFLVAALERYVRRGADRDRVLRHCLFGVDVDPEAVARCGERLGGGCLSVADGLRWQPSTPIDVVATNPPFLGQLRTLTARSPAATPAGGRRGYADTAALFLERAVGWLRPGGRIGMVLPTSVLASRDAAAARAALSAAGTIDVLWVATTAMFDASVRPCVLVAAAASETPATSTTATAAPATAAPASAAPGAARPVARYAGPAFTRVSDGQAPAAAGPATWGALLAGVLGVPPVELGAGPTLATLAEATADFRDQFYGLVGSVADGGAGHRLVTVGLIEPNECLWGRRPTRFAGARYERPTVSVVPDALRSWAQRRLVPKVLVATQTKVIEAVVDEAGEWLPSVPVISVVPRQAADLWLVAAALSSPVASAWAMHRCAGAALTLDTIKLSATDVVALPLPPDPARLQPAAAALAAGDLREAGAASVAAYELAPADAADLLGWWTERLRPRR